MKCWDEFYLSFNDSTPTPFAQHCLAAVDAFQIKQTDFVVDVGCGTGRDTAFFAEKGIRVIGLDSSQVALNKPSVGKIAQHTLWCDFSDIHLIKLPFKPTVIYARFVVHAVPLETEQKLLAWAARVLPTGGKFLSESRTIYDRRFGLGKKISEFEFEDGHYRRFLDHTFLNRLQATGFSLASIQFGNNLAIYKDDNPVVLRVAAVKLTGLGN